MRSWFERLTAALVRRGFREGLLGGSGPWLAVGAVAWLARFLARRPERSVVVEEIALGETIIVTSVPPPPSGKQVRREQKHAVTVPAVDDGDASGRKQSGHRHG
jgi:hypothetical protein